jgi:site-specific recombinase XerD
MNRFHIAEFLSYVQTEAVRWGATSTTACRPPNETTVRHYYRTLYTFFRWHCEEGFGTDNPLSQIKTPRIRRKVIQALTPDEVQKLVTALPSKTTLGCRNRAILMMFLDTGMRVSELANLSLDNLQTDTGAIL